MIRMLFTLLVACALLLGVGFWFEPRATGEALAPVLHRTVELARRAPGMLAAHGFVSPVLDGTATLPNPALPGSEDAPPLEADDRPTPTQVEPVAAAVPTPGEIDAIIEESMASVWTAGPQSESAPLADDRGDAGAEQPPDLEERAGLIRRMLDLHRQVSARR